MVEILQRSPTARSKTNVIVDPDGCSNVSRYSAALVVTFLRTFHRLCSRMANKESSEVFML